MCGICGVFEYAQRETVNAEQLQRMNDLLHHRGPDDGGVWVRPHIGLAMRRLSIIDLAGGHQPIYNEDESIWIVFNGEIYNFEQLRQDLIARGHQFRTSTDTEVIVHLYEEYGTACVQHLDGMFAFALYDLRPNGGLFIARDRLGKKPLYYAELHGALIFASELKSVLLDPRVSKELDLEALDHYLSLLVIPAPLSIFRQVKKLPAAHWLFCDKNGARIHQYWNYWDYVGENELPQQDVLPKIRQLLFEAVQKRLVSEVPLGTFLSGGLDSTVVTAIAARSLHHRKLDTFSIGFEGPQIFNEAPLAAQTAKFLKTNHHEVIVSPNVVELVEDLVQYADEPFAISSAMPTYLLAKAARQCMTVVLTGDGGDEVFGGYMQYIYERWAQLYRHMPQAMDQWLCAAAAPRSLPGAKLRQQAYKFAASARKSLVERRLGWASAFSAEEKKSLWVGSARKSDAQDATIAFLRQKLPTRAGHAKNDLSGATLLNALDILVWLPDEMLTKVDRMTMAASLEARCPLLDWPLLEFMAGMSLKMKIPGNYLSLGSGNSLKYLLRESVKDLLPPALMKRRKHGFNVPLDQWFRTGAASYLRDVLDKKRIARRGVFDPDVVDNYVQRHQRGEINGNNRLYALLMFEVWATRYLS